MPLFSIIIPVYNVQNYLSACVKSVVEQPGPRDWECILVDDGSTDQSGAMCDALAAELPGLKVIHRENGGLAAARNTGLKAATGDWLLFLDSDDAMAPGLLAQLRGALAAHPDCDWFIGKHLEWQPDGTLTPHDGLHLVPGPFASSDYAARLKALYTAAGAALMGSMLKDDRDQITLRVSGGGPAGVVIACTDGTGNVKGCIDHPLVELPAKPNGHLDVGGAVGKDGVLTVIRDNRLQKEPTVGQVPLVSGEIAEDLTAYYAYSEQVPTVMALGVLVDKDLSILCAGGFMVQLLPGATDAEIDQLEKNIAAMPSVTTLLHEGKTPEDMMQLALAGFDPNVLDERDVHYQCDCSAERTKEMLFSLGRKELVRMRDEDPACEVVCHFCHSKYQYDLNDLLAEYDAQAAERAAAEQGT